MCPFHLSSSCEGFIPVCLQEVLPVINFIWIIQQQDGGALNTQQYLSLLAIVFSQGVSQPIFVSVVASLCVVLGLPAKDSSPDVCAVFPVWKLSACAPYMGALVYWATGQVIEGHLFSFGGESPLRMPQRCIFYDSRTIPCLTGLESVLKGARWVNTVSNPAQSLCCLAIHSRISQTANWWENFQS